MLLLSVLVSGCDLRTADDHLHIAVALEEAGNVDSAMTHLDLAVNRDPDHLWARLDRGALRSQSGDQAGAIADDDEVIRRDPNNMTAYFNRALARQRSGDAKGALADLRHTYELKTGGEDDPRVSRIIFEPADDPWLGIQKPEFDIPMADIAYCLAIAYLDVDSVRDGYRWLNYCIQRNIHVDECSYQRGSILYNNGDTVNGCADLERAALLHHPEALRAWNRHCTTPR